MFIEIDSDFADGELKNLIELLEMLDKKLLEINQSIGRPCNSEYLLDKAEYFVGVGFVLIQQYLVDTLFGTGLKKEEAYCLKPKYNDEYSYIKIFNAAANWWKHESEWFPKKSQGEDSKIMKIPNGRTVNIIKSIAKDDDYVLSNVLHKLYEDKPMVLMNLVPDLIAWREEVHRARQK